MYIVIFALQFLGGFAAVAMVGGIIINVWPNAKIVVWALETNARLTKVWLGLAFVFALIFTVWMPEAPPDCVETQGGDYRC